MSAQNPDFTIESKKLIAETVRRVMSRPADNTNVPRPTYPRGAGSKLPAGQYDGMVLQTTSQLTLGAGFLRLVNVPPV